MRPCPLSLLPLCVLSDPNELHMMHPRVCVHVISRHYIWDPCFLTGLLNRPHSSLLLLGLRTMVCPSSILRRGRQTQLSRHYHMPVASYIDIEILGLVRLIGMWISDKHIRRGSDDPLGSPPWDKDLSEIFVRSFSDPWSFWDLCEIFFRFLCLGSHTVSRLLQINIPSRKDNQLNL